MNLIEELNKLKPLIGSDTEAFDKQLKVIQDNFTSAEDLRTIDDFIRSGLNEATADLKAFNTELSLRMQLNEVSQIVSLAYISKNYFHKTRGWFHQRLSGQKVNGKPAKFTSSEIDTLNYALRDIGKKIGSTVISA
ncbi:hypothetical protein FACS189440_21080 [Bacteroidia bacterium]|nr:hypothetical protein FACS189440_21080 [Bacteroidia bacterium]